MAVDLIAYSNSREMEEEHVAIHEAASAGVRSMEQLILRLSHQTYQHGSSQQQQEEPDCPEISHLAAAKLRKAISILNRTGHARFRRGPSATAASVSYTTCPSPSLSAVNVVSIPPPMPSATSSFVTFTGDGSVSNRKQGSPTLHLGVAGGAAGSPTTTANTTMSAGKPPLLKCHGHGHSGNITVKCSSECGNGCHCSKRRKHRVKRTIRVPAISSRIADIPPDEYSWRKYGQKPIKGSPYPRGYYKCSSLRGCPARKQVERAPDDPSMMIVTYGGEHRHGPDVAARRAAGSASATRAADSLKLEEESSP